MQKFCFLLPLATTLLVNAQSDSLTKTRVVIGLSAPELFHAGINIDLGKFNQIGIGAGLGPSWGAVWPTLNIEHRLYFGTINGATNRKRWFFKQGATRFTAAENQSAVSFTVGQDLRSKARNRGWTVDLGGLVLIQNDRDKKNKVYPALRFQYYSYLKREKQK